MQNTAQCIFCIFDIYIKYICTPQFADVQWGPAIVVAPHLRLDLDPTCCQISSTLHRLHRIPLSELDQVALYFTSCQWPQGGHPIGTGLAGLAASSAAALGSGSPRGGHSRLATARRSRSSSESARRSASPGRHGDGVCASLPKASSSSFKFVTLWACGRVQWL
jgi:hypothetical protein